MQINERLSLIAFKSAWAAGKIVPKPIFTTLFLAVGKLLFKRDGISILRLKFNISRVLGLDIADARVTEVSRSAYLNYLRYWSDLFWMPRVPNDQLHKYVEMSGLDILQQAKSQGRGVLVVAPHAGNWDLAGAVAADKFGRLTSVAERLKPEELFQLFVKSREPRGIEILPHRGGAKPAFEILQERLKSGGLVGMATDRDMSRSGVEVDFFGAKAKMPSGPARLFQNTGCVVVPVKVFYSGKKTHIEFMPALDLVGNTETDTQTMAAALQEIIESNPDNWFMLQQVWLDHPKEFGGR